MIGTIQMLHIQQAVIASFYSAEVHRAAEMCQLLHAKHGATA